MVKKTTDRQWLTPAEAARIYGIKGAKIRALIASGEIRAVDMSERGRRGSRPRWRIHATALLEFENRRINAPKQDPQRRRKARDLSIIEYV
jgi:excisionase family DNA binding protein